MSARCAAIAIAVSVILLNASNSVARDYPPDSSSNPTEYPVPTAGLSAADSTGPIPWPTLYGVHQTDAVITAFDCFGTVGLRRNAGIPPYPFWPHESFESPPGSGHQYLFSGTIWVGGIVGGDTLVTTGFDTWGYAQAMYPTGYSSTHGQGTVTPFAYPTATSMRAEFDDTVHSGLNYPADRFGHPYKPLNIALVNRTHSFEGHRADECIVHDVTVTNVGRQTIRQGYFGIYLDPDVYSTHGNLYGNEDDLAGSIRNKGIAYVVDNDGDPMGGAYTPTRSPTKALAFKYLNISFVPRDTNFNWWIPSSNPESDFSPRQKAYPRDFGIFGNGTPYGDGNEYYVMSTPEWDYDQVMTSTIQPDDPQWEYPNPLTNGLFHRGADTRFLMSIGPFDLLPDSAIRVQFAVFTADSVHTDPFILDFVDIAPELYALTLNLASVTRNAAIADSLANLMIDPALPPTGLHLDNLSDTAATVGWDAWVLPKVDSCDIFLSPIPDSAFRHGRTIPIWYRPTELELVNQVVGSVVRTALTGLTPGRAYACNMAWQSGNQTGDVSAPMLFRTPDARYDLHVIDSILFVVQGGNPVIRWSGSGTGAVDHFNVYRFADSAAAGSKYLPFYSRLRLNSGPVDSLVIGDSLFYYYALPMYAQVPGNTFEFEDSEWADGNSYAVTAVDSAGTEFPFSNVVTVYWIPPRTKDICVLTNSGGKVSFVLGSTLKSFYTSLLSGYRHNIFSYVDSMSAGCGIYPQECIDWRTFAAYRTLIIDDGLKDALFSSQFEDATGGFRKYLESGGTIVYFGSFSFVGGYRFDPLHSPAWHDLPHPMVSNNFGVDSVFYVGVAYYHNHSTEPYVDSLFGFVRAQSTVGGAPDLQFDLSRDPFSVDLATYWPEGTAPIVSAFKANGRGEVTHVYRSASPATSVNEGQPVGIVTKLAKGQTFLFGFHLWYMEPVGARQLVDWIMGQVATDAPDESKVSLPRAVALSQNYPNPFNPTTTIEYSVPAKSSVRIEIYNILGQQVRTLVDETLAAGKHSITFDGKNSSGQNLSSGVYLYRLVSDHGTATRKMILLK